MNLGTKPFIHLPRKEDNPATNKQFWNIKELIGANLATETMKYLMDSCSALCSNLQHTDNTSLKLKLHFFLNFEKC